MRDLEQRVAEAYERRWGAQPDRILVAPGRINVIGDHTDYSLLPVLPIAIQFAIAFAVGSGGDGVVVDSINEPAELTVERTPASAASWHRYVDIALRMLPEPPTGTRVMIGGDLPSTGGLSSSSALVVGLLAAVTAAGPDPLRGQRLVDAAVAAERMAAIEGGAMDQTIIVFGESGAAVRLEFDPPSRRTVPIPDGLVFVAAYSGEQAAKGTAAKDSYNTRVVACRCAAALLAARMRIEPPDPLVLGRLGVVPDAAIDALPVEGTPRNVAASAGVSVSGLVAMAAGDFPHDRTIPIRAIARHVFREAAAVDAVEAAMGAGDLARVGALLNASHQSLRSFGSSTEALDQLTTAMVEAGALGARVTGAGFGGYAIAVCKAEHTRAVIAAAESATGGPAFEVTPSRGIG